MDIECWHTVNFNAGDDIHTIGILLLFQEVDIGLAADVGTLQRLPKVIGNDSLCRELCYTARPFYSAEAKEFGLVRCV